MGLIRNLSAGEIVEQVLEARRDATGLPLRNIVFMGMGEPFHNYDQVMTALEILTDEYGFNFSQRRVTVSTSGLVPQIRRFGQERVKANLAISLNGSSDTVRGRLMPSQQALQPSPVSSSLPGVPT
jgi:23S rRNA (adenine2503-C2)-methyltransferase